jgi:cell volume regulation protein A
MPKGHRICALFRGQELLHPRAVPACNPMTSLRHRPRARYPPSVSLFSQAPEQDLGRALYGDFLLEANARLVDLAPCTAGCERVADRTLGDFITR